jgi:predicted O-methyltransferase YrrM
MKTGVLRLLFVVVVLAGEPLVDTVQPKYLVDIKLPLDGKDVFANKFKWAVSANTQHPTWPSVTEVCITLNREPVMRNASVYAPGESQTACFPKESIGWQQGGTELSIYSLFEFSVSFKRGTQLLSGNEVSSRFRYIVPPLCQEKLDAAVGVMHNAYNKNGQDPHHRVAQSPLCYETYHLHQEDFNDNNLQELMSTASGFRGSFGVDMTMQEFGFGDQMMLHFVLSRHREAKRFVELGTFTGVTSLHWGIAASLRQGELDSFDFTDWRPEHVKRTWLHNMHFHIADLSNGVFTPVLEERAREADIVFIDADPPNFTRLEQALRLGPTMPAGSLILIHDFPGGTPARMAAQDAQEVWEEGLAGVGFRPVYRDMRLFLVSTLACFEKVA